MQDQNAIGKILQMARPWKLRKLNLNGCQVRTSSTHPICIAYIYTHPFQNSSARSSQLTLIFSRLLLPGSNRGTDLKKLFDFLCVERNQAVKRTSLNSKDEIKNMIFKLVDDNQSFEGIIIEVGSDDPVGSLNKNVLLFRGQWLKNCSGGQQSLVQRFELRM